MLVASMDMNTVAALVNSYRSAQTNAATLTYGFLAVAIGNRLLFLFCYIGIQVIIIKVNHYGRGAKYCDQRASTYVYLFVCLSTCVSKKVCPDFTNFLHILHVAVTWSLSDGYEIGYVLYFQFCGRCHVFA